MHRALSRGLMVALMLSSAVFAQSHSEDSLGDVARASRAKQEAQQSPGNAPKVITDQDLLADVPGASASVSSKAITKGPSTGKADHSVAGRNNNLNAQRRVNEQWKARIQDQENRISDLQARIDHVNEAIRTAVGTAQYDTPANRTQAIQMDRLANLQQTLVQEKRKLDQMQDAARRAGASQ